ncbi:MAG: hypothetical protein JXR22_01390 [Prolixibacteraceae bacterium]|nr:hypothetical protein [Prolixibacteraceae bacterium]
MEIILIIVLGLFVVVAVAILYRVNQKRKKESAAPEAPAAPASDCCGAHEVCEYDEIKMDETRIEYYDDEELDVYQNMDARAYTDQQIDQFREVLYTLKQEEIRYWLLSIERRKIMLPSILIEEARMLMADQQ